MNISESWVSHTPETTPKDYQDFEEDFASAADPIDFKQPLPPPSPPNAFEKFFLPFETTEGNPTPTSSFAKAASRLFKPNTTNSRKYISSSSKSLASESLLTEDFASAADDLSETSDLDDISLDESAAARNTFLNDILGRQAILEESPEEEYEQITMAKKSKSTKPVVKVTDPADPVVATPEPATTTTAAKDSKPKFDVVENVYEGAKSIWAFGKGIIVFKPFMGVAEGAATKVLGMTTGVSSLEDADKHIKSTLAGVDQEFIDPAILKLWSMIEPIIGKGDEVFKMVFETVVKKVPMLEGDKSSEAAAPPSVVKESEEATSPETSTPAVTTVA
jgi:hypothetical protein